MKKQRPCDNCPWRKDAPRGYWDPQHFVDIARHCRDDGTHSMACHKSTPEDPILCAGYILVVGFDSIGLRIAAVRGEVSMKDYDAEGLELFSGYEEMLKANGVPVPPRNRMVDP